MKSLKTQNVYHSKKVFVIILSFFSIYLFNCSSLSDLRVSEFKFNYNGENYLLRSAYCPKNPRSCNQIIGPNFIASDMNQDRIIDEVINGDIEISKAQTIYDYCLDVLAKQGKVNEIDMGNKTFSFSEGNKSYEIKSFSSVKGNNFNQFSIKDNFYSGINEISVYIDENSDGTLDEILKGKIAISEAQNKYSMVIEKGIIARKISKVNGYILTK